MRWEKVIPVRIRPEEARLSPSGFAPVHPMGDFMVSQSFPEQAGAVGGFGHQAVNLAGRSKIASLHRAQMRGTKLGLLYDESFKTLGQGSTC